MSTKSKVSRTQFLAEVQKEQKARGCTYDAAFAAVAERCGMKAPEIANEKPIDPRFQAEVRIFMDATDLPYEIAFNNCAAIFPQFLNATQTDKADAYDPEAAKAAGEALQNQIEEVIKAKGWDRVTGYPKAYNLVFNDPKNAALVAKLKQPQLGVVTTLNRAGFRSESATRQTTVPTIRMAGVGRAYSAEGKNKPSKPRLDPPGVTSYPGSDAGLSWRQGQ